jgi:hypothetical protein
MQEMPQSTGLSLNHALGLIGERESPDDDGQELGNIQEGREQKKQLGISDIHKFTQMRTTQAKQRRPMF